MSLKKRPTEKGGLHPLLTELCLTFLLGSMETPGEAFIQTHHLNSLSQNKLDQAKASTTDSLEFLQQQIPSLVEFLYENKKALDFLTAEQGGTCT